ncbi:MAG: HAMP domain-containing sensor histidine kinase [Candidatus Binatia bacterium]
MASGAFDARTREALAEVEGQRDDAVVYLSTLREILAVLARGHGLRACAQGIAEVVVRGLGVESAALVVQEPEAELALEGFATQAQRLGGPSVGLGESGWLALARLVGPAPEPSCFRRTPDGGFAAVSAAELAGEGFLVLPFPVGDEATGALVLHWVLTPAQRFWRTPALALVGEAVGQAITVARARDASERACETLREELGMAKQAVSARDENIERLARALVRSNRVKREFLGTVSHELRTPLNAILGYATLLRDGTVGELEASQVGMLDRIVGATRNLNELIGDVLFFVQVEADRVVLRPRETPAAELVEEATSALRDRPPPDRVTYAVEIAPAAAVLHVDPALMRRVLFHLIGTAFKFTSKGRVTVRLEPGEEPGAAVLTVCDTGAGMPAERVDELFDLFTQADSSTTRRYGGMGMGLTLVQRCVRLLGGEIMVESQPGVGTTFRLFLPAVLAGAAAGDDMASAVRPLP